jgi:hypothetical protein
VNRSGAPVVVPAITNAAKALGRDITLAGEICAYQDGIPGRNFDVSKALSNPAGADIRFAAFDIVEDSGQPPAEDLKARHDRLAELLPREGAVFALRQDILTSRKDIASFYNANIEQHEGIVVKSSHGIVYKAKPVKSLDLVILGFSEGSGERQGKVRDLLLGHMTADGHYQVLSSCSNGLDENLRQELYALLSPMAASSDYVRVSGAQTAFTMVRPELAVEVTCLDVLTENSTGPIKQIVLGYNPDQGYFRLRWGQSGSLIGAVFSRLRNDKAPSIANTGPGQLEPFLPEAAEDEPVSMEASTVMAREVYTKSGKNGTAVRKFVILQTHKEHTSLYAPFLVVYTDFSGGRKSPLEQELFLCSSLEEARAKWSALKAENIKKGWEEPKK